MTKSREEQYAAVGALYIADYEAFEVCYANAKRLHEQGNSIECEYLLDELAVYAEGKHKGANPEIIIPEQWADAARAAGFTVRL